MPRDASLPSPATPLVGRRAALRTLAEVFGRGERLVTIVGTGGIGKTRLALEHGHRRRERGDRVRFCELDEQRDHEGLLTSVARALGARGVSSEELIGALRRLQPGLLVLDNFEQLAPHAGQLAEWLDACPQLRVVVTSREVLRLEREVVLELDPLELEVTDGADRPSEALLLWSMARQRLDPSYSAARDDAAALEGIVRGLDGIPLAIELAAARANLMSTKQLAARLGQRFEVLRERSRDRSSRRATMEGALDWSWELLDPWERDALAQCSVFRNGFSLDGAEAVVDLSAHEAPPSVLDVLQALRDKSLLRRMHDEPDRLTMFATIRDYGARRLALDERAVRAAERRHGRYFARLGLGLMEASLGPAGADALSALAADLDNLLVTIERAVEPDGVAADGIAADGIAADGIAADGVDDALHDLLNDALDAAVAANGVFSTRGPTGGHRELLDALLARSDAPGVDPLRHSRALRVRGLLAASAGHLSRGREDLERAVALAAASGPALGRALVDLSWTYLRQRDLDRVVSLCNEALLLAREAGDRALEGLALGALGAPPKERGDAAEAARLYTGALTLHREAGHRWYEGLAHTRLAILSLEHDDLPRAREHSEAALTVHREFGIRAAEALLLQCLGGAAHLGGQLDEARDCYAESASIAASIGDLRLRGTGLGYRAVAELELGDLEAAREHLEEACRVTAQVGEHRHSALFRAYVGAVDALVGRPEDAREHLRTARALLSAHADLKIEASVEALSALPSVTRAARGEAGAREEADLCVARARARRGPLETPEKSSADVRIALRIVGHALAALDAADTSEAALRVDPGGAWFEPPNGARVDCRRRQALRRIMVRLARARIQQPGIAISAEALIAAGWPDEKMSTASAQNRLYVTINRLRQLGLSDALELVEGGYRFDPGLPLALVPEAAPRPGA